MRTGNHVPPSVTFVATSRRRHIPVVGERNGKKDARKLEYAWLGCSFPIDTISLIIFEERRISAGASASSVDVILEAFDSVIFRPEVNFEMVMLLGLVN